MIFFPHPAQSCGPPAVFAGSDLTDMVIVLEERKKNIYRVGQIRFGNKHTNPVKRVEVVEEKPEPKQSTLYGLSQYLPL